MKNITLVTRDHFAGVSIKDRVEFLIRGLNIRKTNSKTVFEPGIVSAELVATKVFVLRGGLTMTISTAA